MMRSITTLLSARHLLAAAPLLVPMLAFDAPDLGATEKQRLHELGLLPGSSMRVVKSDPQDGLIVTVREDGRLALNRSTAQKLIVCLVGTR